MTRKLSRVFGSHDHSSVSGTTSQNHALASTGVGLALSLLLSTGCTQDYEISAVEADDTVDVTPTIAPSVTPNATAAGSTQAVESEVRTGAGSAVPSAPETGAGLCSNYSC